jgi:hypothetical protein
MDTSNYEYLEEFINRMKMNIDLYMKKEFKELNRLYELNIIKIKREIETYVKNLNTNQQIELNEEIGYDIIYYEISQELSNDKYDKKMNNCLVKYLSSLQNFINKKN